MKILLRCVCLSLLQLVLFSASGSSFAAMPWPADEGVEIGHEGQTHGLPDGFEPSGAVWHAVRQTLFLVDDGGLIAEVDPDLGVLSLWDVEGDIEGITIVDPDDGMVYVALENPDGVLEFDLTSGTATGEHWDLTPWLDGPDNRGLEALTSVGGHFYAGLQEDGTVFMFDLLDDGAVEYLGSMASHDGRDDISGLHFDPCTEILFAVFDSHDVIVEMTADGVFLREYELAGENQEGVAIIGESTSGETTIFIAEDSGGVWMYGQYPMAPCTGLSSTWEPPSFRFAHLVCIPNPFNPKTNIHFELESSQMVGLSIHDLGGRLVWDLAPCPFGPGEHSLSWNGRSLDGLPMASGVYFARLKTSSHDETVKLVLTR